VVEREVWLRGPQLFQGYRADPDATAATLDAGGWLHTGDLGTVDADGYVTLTGRAKELIKVRGFQVAPAELELLLLEHPAVADACVAGVPDEYSGERQKAWIVTSGAVDLDELRAAVDAQVSPYKRPAAIEVLDELPRTMPGKLLRRVLVERERTAVAVSP
jgi:acyl-CoA synthetase (AMP-forming)/AMP-acid ligase II